MVIKVYFLYMDGKINFIININYGRNKLRWRNKLKVLKIVFELIKLYLEIVRWNFNWLILSKKRLIEW